MSALAQAKSSRKLMIYCFFSVFSKKAKTRRNHLDYSKVSLHFISFSAQPVHLQTAMNNTPDHKLVSAGVQNRLAQFFSRLRPFAHSHTG